MQENLFSEGSAPVSDEINVKQRGKAPQLWCCTWEECLAVYAGGGSLVTIEGRMIAGPSRKMEQIGISRAKEMYLDTLKIAFEKGKEIPPRVIESEDSFFSSLRKSWNVI
jgi:hypothetical protein